MLAPPRNGGMVAPASFSPQALPPRWPDDQTSPAIGRDGKETIVKEKKGKEPQGEVSQSVESGTQAAATEAAGGPTAETQVEGGVNAAAQALAGSPKAKPGAAPGYIASRQEVADHIVTASRKRGIDPEIALNVYRHEGESNWQSQYRGAAKTYNGKEDSWGPYQLYMGGGLGNAFKKKTGLDPRDPNTWRENIDFALDEAARGGWGPWYGARRAGISNRQGLEGASPVGIGSYAAAPMSFTDYARDGAYRPVVQHQGPGNKRPLPISTRLESDLGDVSGKHGLVAEVWSGGQKPGQGTGSHRHDHGNAADLKLRDAQDGHILNMNDPVDRKRMAGFVTDMVSRGWLGVGAGNGYMGAESMHIGGGAPSAWGAGGKAANAPSWLREAWQTGINNR